MVNTKRRHKTPTKSSSTKREIQAKQLVLDKCCLELYESSEQNGGKSHMVLLQLW